MQQPAFDNMDSIAKSPPKTLLTDVMLLLGFSLITGEVLHWMRGSWVRLGKETAAVRKRCPIANLVRNDISAEEVEAVRQHHRSWIPFLLNWLPLSSKSDFTDTFDEPDNSQPWKRK